MLKKKLNVQLVEGAIDMGKDNTSPKHPIKVSGEWKKFKPNSQPLDKTDGHTLKSLSDAGAQSQDEQARSRKADSTFNRVTGYALKPKSNKRGGSPDTQILEDKRLCKSCYHFKSINDFRNREDKKTTNYCLECERAERKEYAKTYTKDPLKARARNLLWNYIKSNKIIIENCSQCGSSENVDLHHPDYNKPLEFVSLCHKCHMRLHNGEK